MAPPARGAHALLAPQPAEAWRCSRAPVCAPLPNPTFDLSDHLPHVREITFGMLCRATHVSSSFPEVFSSPLGRAHSTPLLPLSSPQHAAFPCRLVHFQPSCHARSHSPLLPLSPPRPVLPPSSTCPYTVLAPTFVQCTSSACYTGAVWAVRQNNTVAASSRVERLS